MISLRRIQNKLGSMPRAPLSFVDQKGVRSISEIVMPKAEVLTDDGAVKNTERIVRCEEYLLLGFKHSILGHSHA
jgi:hypothetical protein